MNPEWNDPSGYPAVLDIIQKALTDQLWELEQGNLQPDDRKEKFQAFIARELERRQLGCPGLTTQELTVRIYNDTQRYSVLTPWLDNPQVEGIHINSWKDIRVCRTDGRYEDIDGFMNPSHAVDIVRRLLQASRVTMDAAVPVAEASLDNRIRITAVMPPVVDDSVGVAAYIRILRMEVFQEEEYIQFGFATKEMLNLIKLAVRRGVSTLFVGKRDSGKTTLMQHVLNATPENMQVVTIETGAREMDLNRGSKDNEGRSHAVHLLSRESEIEQQNITQEKLIVKALRLNPDVTAVAEARDTEAYNAVEMSLSGHTVVTTAHAGGPRLGHQRIATLVRKKYANDYTATLADACSAFPLVVFLHMTDDHVRRIMDISECWLENGQPCYRTLWEYRVIENQSSILGTKVLGEFTPVNAVSEHLIDRMKLYGLTGTELAELLEQPKATQADAAAVAEQSKHADEEARKASRPRTARRKGEIT